MIHGFYGKGNVGDDLILHSFLQRLPSDAEVTVLCTEPDQVKKQFNVDAVNTKKFGSFKCRSLIKGSDLFLLGGGGLIKDYGKNHKNMMSWLKYLDYANHHHVNTGTLCVGVRNIVNPVSTYLVNRVLNETGSVLVRDLVSKQALVDVGVDEEKILVTGDIVLHHVQRPRLRELSMHPRVLVSMRHWHRTGFKEDNPKLFKQIKKDIAWAVDYLEEEYDASVDFVPFRISDYDDDRVVLREVDGFCTRDHLITAIPSVGSVFDLVDSYEMVLGMRLHSLIIAGLLGIPMIGLEYATKIYGYMELIGQNRFSDNFYNLNQEKLGGMIDETMNGYRKRNVRIVEQVNKIKRGQGKVIDSLWS